MALRLGLPGGRARSETREKSGAGEMGNGSRSEVRGFQNSKLRTQNSELRTSCRASFAETAWHDRELDRPSLRGR